MNVEAAWDNVVSGFIPATDSWQSARTESRSSILYEIRNILTAHEIFSACGVNLREIELVTG